MSRVRERVAAAAHRSGRDPGDVVLIAVTKYHGAEIADAIVQAGVHDIGENRLQVAKPKFASMTTKPTRHFIGPLQTNKVKQVLELFDVVHSVDRIELALEINKRAAQLGRNVPCFAQVNVSGEASKGGFEPNDLPGALEEIAAQCPNIVVRGLMTMAPESANPDNARPHFARLRQLLEQARKAGHDICSLSMGMSGDFEVAIEEGATHVRIGSALYEGLEA